MTQKTQKSNVKKSIIYVVIAILAAILGVVMILKALDDATSNEPTTTVTIAEKQAEKVTARIDLTTALADPDNPPFEVYVNKSEKPEAQMDWMQKLGYQGYTIQKTDNKVSMLIKVLKDCEMTVILRGPDKRDANKKIIENWVDYTSVTVDGEEILPKTTAAWHNKVFRHMINATAGDEIEIKAKWTKHEPIVVE